jgi:hypothetical protein
LDSLVQDGGDGIKMSYKPLSTKEKKSIRDFKKIDAPYSDVQGIAMAMASDLSKDATAKRYIEEELLSYYNGGLNAVETIRAIERWRFLYK